jgi:prepilin-type N-terminal cleavage/methylation domain-containing protein
MLRKAFTLIELLIVIAVLGGLIAIVIPALRHSRTQAKSVICSSNLGQLAVLMNLYASFHRTYPPGICSLPAYLGIPPGGRIDNATIDRAGWWWFHFLMDTNESPEVVKKMLTCPSSIDTESPDLNVLCGNYGVNYSICKLSTMTLTDEFRGRPLSPSSMRRPAQNILLADSGFALMSWKAASSDTTLTFECPTRRDVYYIPGLSINAGKTLYPDLQADAVNGRHPKRSLNTIFADGAARKMSAEDLVITTSNPSDSPSYLIWSPASN